jgi:hypothetical protein
MFLVYCSPQQNITEYVLGFIEAHSVLVGVITSVLASSLWLRKFLKQKRAEAFFGFYSKLSLCLKSLQVRLKENGQLNIIEPKNGNIYALIYLNDYIGEACPSYKKPDDRELKLYQDAAKELKKILLDTENNVYPLGSDRKRWYESQFILFSFCEFLENEANWHLTNKDSTDEKGEPKHIVKCKMLIEAMDYIQYSISHAKY